MKKDFTLKSILTVMAIILSVSGMYAQDTLRVPDEYANVRHALFALKGGDKTDVTDAVILVAEGDIKTTASFGNIRRAVKVTVIGAGADKTFISGYDEFEGMPFPGEGGRRFLNQNEDSNAGSEFIFKDLGFKRWGFGDGNGGAVVNLLGVDQKITFINCHFENIQAEKGAIVQSNRIENTVTFENCFITNCTSIDRGGMNGLINVSAGALKISNTTFMSNVRNPVTNGDFADEEREARKAGVISLESSADNPLTFEMTDCAFVNNQTVADASDVIQPMISIYPVDGSVTAKLEGNIMIGNLRDGKANDVDIYIDDMDKITWENSDNVLNRSLKREAAESENFVPGEIPGVTESADFTYTHESIMFEMDGDLPKILVDENGVNYVTYEGSGTVGTRITKDMNIKVYPNPSGGMFHVMLPQQLTAANYKVYNSVGALVKSGLLNSNNQVIDMTGSNRGIYILNLDRGGQNIARKLVIE